MPLKGSNCFLVPLNASNRGFDAPQRFKSCFRWPLRVQMVFVMPLKGSNRGGDAPEKFKSCFDAP